jgi:hypothetical protein
MAQVSQGGYPLAVEELKSAFSSKNGKMVRMHSFDIQQEILKSAALSSEKSIRFAHGFQVDLTPENSGEWFYVQDYRVWKLTIHSDSALSLGVIFKNYRIPDNARLYVYNQNKETVLGAFTSINNKPYKRFAIHPVDGDEITIQYEEPLNAEFKGDLEIEKINHDFLGIGSLKNRWSRRPSGACNVDVNCETASGLDDQKRSVVRILADDELGTGTLLNNTNNDGKPYLISAFHIFDHDSIAEITLYDFNYESPFCTKLEGFDLQSISGSKAIASFDSLDFMFVELSEIPPASYRPYYSGWSTLTVSPSNTYTIHHPNGDVKKMSYDSGTCDSLYYSSMFSKFAHWKVLNWEKGTTEGGSSGSGLFDNNKRLVGTLSGGYASCTNLSYDAFARFDKMWNTQKDKKKQLMPWLDPKGTGEKVINGYDPYRATSENCVFYSNFLMEDTSVTLPANSQGGYYSGSNSMGITEIAEGFNQFEYGQIAGIALGINEFKYTSGNPELEVNIYTGTTLPEKLIKQVYVPLNKILNKAMNYFAFAEPVVFTGNFFVGIKLPTGKDSIVFYQSPMRAIGKSATMAVKSENKWEKLGAYAGREADGSSLLMQVNVCSAKVLVEVDTVTIEDNWVKIYPNPATDKFIVELNERKPFRVSLFDMTGRSVLTNDFNNLLYTEIPTTGLTPGIFLLQIISEGRKSTKRLVLN